jgi:hypothetical protein
MLSMLSILDPFNCNTVSQLDLVFMCGLNDVEEVFVMVRRNVRFWLKEIIYCKLKG